MDAFAVAFLGWVAGIEDFPFAFRGWAPVFSLPPAGPDFAVHAVFDSTAMGAVFHSTAQSRVL